MGVTFAGKSALLISSTVLTITLSVAAGVLLLCLIIFLIVMNRSNNMDKCREVVKANSNLCHALRALNVKYKFYTDIKPRYEFFDACATVADLEQVSLYDILLSKLKSESAFFDNLMRRVYTNRVNYDAYCKEYANLRAITPRSDPRYFGMKQDVFYNIENQLFAEGKLFPILSYAVYIKMTCPGSNAVKEYEFSFDELIQAVRVHNGG